MQFRAFYLIHCLSWIGINEWLPFTKNIGCNYLYLHKHNLVNLIVCYVMNCWGYIGFTPSVCLSVCLTCTFCFVVHCLFHGLYSYVAQIQPMREGCGAYHFQINGSRRGDALRNGFYYTRPVLASGYCRCLRLSVCVCDNHVLVLVLTHHPIKLGSPNLNNRCERPWLRSLLFWGAIDPDLQGQI